MALVAAGRDGCAVVAHSSLPSPEPTCAHPDLHTWPRVNPFVPLLGGVLWGSTALSFRRRSPMSDPDISDVSLAGPDVAGMAPAHVGDCRRHECGRAHVIVAA